MLSPGVGVMDSETQQRPYSREWFERLQSVLGESACRRLGMYVIPDNFLLSVVIPSTTNAIRCSRCSIACELSPFARRSCWSTIAAATGRPNC